MNLDINLLRDIAKEAVVASGEFLKVQFNNSSVPIINNESDIKLNEDIQADKIIKEILLKTNINVYSEEDLNKEFSKDKLFWLIDPLDGTHNFYNKIPIFSSSIALIYDQKPILGVINEFLYSNLYIGINYLGKKSATLNSLDLKVSKIKPRNLSTLITGLPRGFSVNEENSQNFGKDFNSWKKIRMFGSASIACAYVASGKCDHYREFETYFWDVAPGIPLVIGAGGKCEIEYGTFPKVKFIELSNG